MLKITRIDTQTEQRLVLEGRLTEPWTSDLCSHWDETRHTRPDRKFIVDLRGVTRIDRTGEIALAQMASEGAEFLGRGMRIQYLLKILGCKAAERRLQDRPALVPDPRASAGGDRPLEGGPKR